MRPWLTVQVPFAKVRVDKVGPGYISFGPGHVDRHEETQHEFAVNTILFTGLSHI